MHGSFAKVRTYVVPEICSRADRQTDRETDTLVAILAARY